MKTETCYQRDFLIFVLSTPVSVYTLYIAKFWFFTRLFKTGSTPRLITAAARSTLSVNLMISEREKQNFMLSLHLNLWILQTYPA
jgi:hypothetical protein